MLPDLTVLDGGVATSLQALGITMDKPWLTSAVLRSDDGMRALRQVHNDFRSAGCNVLTANTFRTNQRALERMGVPRSQHSGFVRRAIECARIVAADGGPRMLVAGSIAPVEDCYSPELAPDDDLLRCEHGWLAEEMARNGVDLALVETQGNAREAAIAVAAARSAGLNTWVSFVTCDSGTLLDGTPLDVAANISIEQGAEAVLVNCVPLASFPLGGNDALLELGVPVGACPNLEDRSSLGTWQHSEDLLPVSVEATAFATRMNELAQASGWSIVGGCCGATPEHIRALVNTLQMAGRAS